MARNIQSIDLIVCLNSLNTIHSSNISFTSIWVIICTQMRFWDVLSARCPITTRWQSKLSLLVTLISECGDGSRKMLSCCWILWLLGDRNPSEPSTFKLIANLFWIFRWDSTPLGCDEKAQGLIEWIAGGASSPHHHHHYHHQTWSNPSLIHQSIASLLTDFESLSFKSRISN